MFWEIFNFADNADYYRGPDDHIHIKNNTLAKYYWKILKCVIF